MKEDKIISALIGLVGACSNNPKTAGTDSLVIKALAFPLLCPEYDDKALSYVSYDMDEAGLLGLLDEAESLEVNFQTSY